MSHWTAKFHQLSSVVSAYKKKKSCNNSGNRGGRKVRNSAECKLVVRASILIGFSRVENTFAGTGYILCKKSEQLNIFLKYTALTQDVLPCHSNDILSLSVACININGRY